MDNNLVKNEVNLTNNLNYNSAKAMQGSLSIAAVPGTGTAIGISESVEGFPWGITLKFINSNQKGSEIIESISCKFFLKRHRPFESSKFVSIKRVRDPYTRARILLSAEERAKSLQEDWQEKAFPLRLSPDSIAFYNFDFNMIPKEFFWLRWFTKKEKTSIVPNQDLFDRIKKIEVRISVQGGKLMTLHI